MLRDTRRGLTLVEIIIVIAILAILVSVYFLVANPGAQLASARNTRRKTDLQNIMLGIRQNIADQGNGQFSCSAGSIPTSTKNMGSGAGSYNIAPCLTTYLTIIPVDPNASGTYYNSPTDYNTGYSIVIDSSGVIILSAPSAELGKSVSLSR